MKDIQVAGGRFEIRRFATPDDLQSLRENLIFNCTGLGARDLFGDQGMEPVRGQLAILLPQPEVRYAFTGQAGYMFPRADGILLGGTFERGIWSTATERRHRRIIRSHQHLFAGFHGTA